jgi:hypothetical protein
MVQITTGSNLITVAITNLIVNPVDVTQLVSGLEFSLSTTHTPTSVTNDPATSGPLIDKTTWSATPVHDTTDTVTNWANISTTIGTIYIAAVGHAPAADLIIGNPRSSGSYSGQNGSITNCHACPLIEGYATFNIALAGVTPTTTIDRSSVFANFGTAVTETLQLEASAPEPAPVYLTFSAVVVLIFRRRWLRRLRETGTH